MHTETKHTAIPARVKERVRARDGGNCIICGSPGEPCCHVVRRSQGGMGVPGNVVTLCNACHYAFDEGLFMKRLEPLGFRSRADIAAFIYDYMRQQYPGWKASTVTYHKL